MGYLIRGNLRKPRLEVFDALCAKVEELFGEPICAGAVDNEKLQQCPLNPLPSTPSPPRETQSPCLPTQPPPQTIGDKYEVLLIEDPEAIDGDDAPLPRPATPSSKDASGASTSGGAPEVDVKVAFQIVPAAAAVPPQSNGWRVTVAGVLLLFFLASCVQLSLVANITKLPKVRKGGFVGPWFRRGQRSGGVLLREMMLVVANASWTFLTLKPPRRLIVSPPTGDPRILCQPRQHQLRGPPPGLGKLGPRPLPRLRPPHLHVPPGCELHARNRPPHRGGRSRREVGADVLHTEPADRQLWGHHALCVDAQAAAGHVGRGGGGADRRRAGQLGAGESWGRCCFLFWLSCDSACHVMLGLLQSCPESLLANPKPQPTNRHQPTNPNHPTNPPQPTHPQLIVGLQQSQQGGLPSELLVPVPTQLFQGSLLLGTATRVCLGELAMAKSEVMISPLVIAGWCGLITTSLNLLPVGNLDGGRMTQAAFGNQALSLSSFFTYVGLGLGLLGSSLSLPFGIYVLICQRGAEKYIKDSVTGISGPKQTATAVAVLTAILILVPMAPELAQSVGVGPTPNLFM